MNFFLFQLSGYAKYVQINDAPFHSQFFLRSNFSAHHSEFCRPQALSRKMLPKAPKTESPQEDHRAIKVDPFSGQR